MGARGQALKTGGFKKYCYHTIMRYNNIRFVVQNEGKSIKLPEMSNSRWAVYVTLGKDGGIKSVSFYNGTRRRYKEIDLIDHKGLGTHVHTCNPKTSLRIDDKVAPRKLTSYEVHRLNRIIDFYKKHSLREKATDHYDGGKK